MGRNYPMMAYARLYQYWDLRGMGILLRNLDCCRIRALTTVTAVESNHVLQRADACFPLALLLFNMRRKRQKEGCENEG